MPRSSTLRTSPWSSKKVIFSKSLGADGANLAAAALPMVAHRLHLKKIFDLN
jgi:hypothetical protein